MREILEELSEDEKSKETIIVIGNNEILQKFLVNEVYKKLIEGYKSNFLLEEFMRMMHNNA